MTADQAEKFGRFELLERVSVGGMGEVYRARWGNRTYALKKLPKDAATDPMLSAMFIDEGRIAASVSGSGLVRFIEHGDVDGRHYLLFEWLDGVTLEALLARLERDGERMPVDQVARLFARIAEALERLHAGVDSEGRPTETVHRDLSPSNILVDGDGTPVLVDFGLSKSRLQRTKTEPGFVKGKFGYLAPEQLDGQADARTDLFALGICFYEALTGARLFDRPTIDAGIEALRSFEGIRSVRPLRPEVPEALDEVVCTLLAPAPANRFQTAGDVKRAIYGAKPGLLLSGFDLDESNGALVSHYFPVQALDRRARAESPRERAPRDDDRTLRIDIGGKVATTVILVLLVALGAFVGTAVLMR